MPRSTLQDPRDRLPSLVNGAQTIAISEDGTVVLAFRAEGVYDKYVTWAVAWMPEAHKDAGVPLETTSGHYFDDIFQAVKDFAQRAGVDLTKVEVRL